MQNSYKKYTKEEDNLIIKAISENPNNINQAIKSLSIKLGRSEGALTIRWYKTLSKKPSSKAFMVYGKKSHLVNRKNGKVVEKHKVSIWNTILNIFNK